MVNSISLIILAMIKPWFCGAKYFTFIILFFDAISVFEIEVKLAGFVFSSLYLSKLVIRVYNGSKSLSLELNGNL